MSREPGKKSQTARGRAHRVRRMREESLKPPLTDGGGARNFALDCGWGRLLFTQTYEKAEDIVQDLRSEGPGRRDIAFYVRDPHLVLAAAPQELFLDPSHTYRLDLSTYRPAGDPPRGFFIRRLATSHDAEEVNRMYASRNMVIVAPDFFWSNRDNRSITYFVVEDGKTGNLLGTVMGVNHGRAFDDPEKGSSLWCLAVDPQATQPGVGVALVRRLAEHFSARGCAFMDLSVMHDNEQAIALYEKLGFTRLHTFAVKRKNVINEALFTSHETNFDALNPYARIIVDEATRRGIGVEIVDAESGFFRLTYGGRSFVCRESLTELTTAIAMSICDDKRATRRIVAKADVNVPAQIDVESDDDIKPFLKKHKSVVVKPARGEQGKGVAVDLSKWRDVSRALSAARKICDDVIVEEFIEGHDLRIIVIDFRVVAGAVRRPAEITGNGKASIRELIEHQSRRRMAATGGESKIPVDAETERCIADAGHEMDDILSADACIAVRKTANLHTGGTIHDVTGQMHPELIDAAVRAARAISIPVTGIDFIVKSPMDPDYWFVEANERPGLANHEPQPTAERFIDLLFPQSMPADARATLQA